MHNIHLTNGCVKRVPWFPLMHSVCQKTRFVEWWFFRGMLSSRQEGVADLDFVFVT